MREEIKKEIEDYLYKKSYNCDGIIRIDEYRFKHIAEKLSYKITELIERESENTITTVGTNLTLKDFGFAEGDYYNKCYNCGEMFIGDKRAFNCSACAKIKLEGAISKQKYTRKQVQKACSNAYQRGVDNRPYIEKFDEWVEDEEFERESGWISVEDRYPDGSKKDGGISDWFNVYVKIEDDWQVAEACYISENTFCNQWGDNINVTHWMPLPNPPKSEEV